MTEKERKIKNKKTAAFAAEVQALSSPFLLGCFFARLAGFRPLCCFFSLLCHKHTSFFVLSRLPLFKSYDL